MTTAATLAQVLVERAHELPDSLFARLYTAAGPVDIGYGELYALACRWASLFDSRALAPGAAVVISLPNDIDFIGAFFGTYLAGLAPAPCLPRRKSDLAHYADTLDRRAQAIGAELIVTDRQSAAKLDCTVAVLAGDSVPDHAGEMLPRSTPESIGLLQFTSGTFDQPKAVELTHAALLHQTGVLKQRLGVDPKHDLGLSWLPLFHDMGMLGFLLTPLLCATPTVLLATEAFARRPTLWFEAIATERATITAGPPSALLPATRLLQRAAGADNTDLSCLRVAVTGAEPVPPDTLEYVRRSLARYGCADTVLTPAYGMAEVGVVATMTAIDEPPGVVCLDRADFVLHDRAVAIDRGDMPITSCGTPVAGTEVRIASDTGAHAGDGVVGEICIRSASLFRQYRGGATAASPVVDGWLHTGDRGFVHHGELFVLGRLGELINVGGTKYLPDDYEYAIRALGNRKIKQVLAIAADDPETGTHRPVVLVESELDEREQAAVRIATRQALTRLDLPRCQLVFVPPRTIARTPNGKLPRNRYRQRFLAGEFANDTP